MDPIAALAYLNSPFPLCYRLIRRNDGNGNMVPVLQGAFLVTKHSSVTQHERGEAFYRVTTHEWRDLETIDEPTSADDHVPFFATDEQSDALQAVCDELADEERAYV
jgi:hypothetical protein